MFTIAAQILLHSVVEAMDWRNNVYVPCAQIVVNIFRHCYCDQFRFRQTLKAYISEKRFAAGYQDTRNSAQKATINWHPGWLGERDACGDLVGDWAQYLDKETFNCQWCNQERKYSSGGKSSLIQHSKSIKHKNIADRADAVFFIYAGTPGMVYHEQVILNIG